MATVLLVFYVPETHTEAVKAAVFSAGGGRIGNYQHCSWQVLGTGQFTPGTASQPYYGEISTTHTVAEHQVQILCESARCADIIRALRQAHPYETPAYYCVDVHATEAVR